MKKFGALVITLILFMLLSANTTEEVYFRFDYQSRNQLDQLTKMVSLDDIEDGKVYAYANKEDFAEFVQLDISYEVLQHPGTLYNPVMTSSTRDLREWDTYPTYEAYVEIMHEFAADYPEICRIENIGTTVEGRDLWVVKISDNVDEHEAEPEFFYTGTMHGDETAGYIMLLRLIDYLLENYGTDTQATEFVDNIEIWINPNANPDGTYHGGNNSVFGAQRFNANSVDINRNFPDPRSGAHPDNNPWQPETIAMMDFAEAHHFVMSANFHGGTEVVNYPWDTWSRRHPDDSWYQFVSHIYADAAQELSPNNYFDGYNDGITNGYDWYQIDGGRQDYMNYFQQCREVTLEISDTKLLPENQLENYWIYNKDAMLNFMEQVMYGFRGIITDITDNAVDAMIIIDGHDQDSTQVFTDPIFGDYYRPIEPGTWDINVTAFGYQNLSIENIQTVVGQITTQDIILTPDPSAISVTGQISNLQNSEPIENATLTILGKAIAPHKTDTNGDFTYYLFADVYEVVVSAPGFIEQTYTITVNSENNHFDLTLDQGPYLEADTNALNFSLYTGDTASETVTITNTGGGVLDFVIITEEADNRNIEDISVTCQSTSFTPGETTDWFITIENNSSDGEWIKGIDIQFPAGVFVNEATDFIGGSGGAMVYNGTTGMAETINWLGETSLGYGVLHDGQIANTSVNVTIEDTMMQNLILGYTVYGDGYGEDPHTVSGNMEIAYPFGWIEISPQSGSLQTGESVDITIDIDTQGLEIGDYLINMILTDNDFNNLVIPVSLTLQAVDTSEDFIPVKVELNANYPNPFNPGNDNRGPATTIDFSLSQQSDNCSLKIYNSKGQLVKTLVNSKLEAGNYSYNWDGKDNQKKNVQSGIYFYKLSTDSSIKTRKMILLK